MSTQLVDPRYQYSTNTDELQLQFPNDQELLLRLYERTEALLTQCSYLVGQLNISLRCAELAFFLSTKSPGNHTKMRHAESDSETPSRERREKKPLTPENNHQYVIPQDLRAILTDIPQQRGLQY